MGHLNMKGLSLEASFSPDGQYVLSGERLLHCLWLFLMSISAFL